MTYFDYIVQGISAGLGWLAENWFYINIFLAIVMIFFQRNEPEGVWAWLLLLYFIPILGFILYMVLHQDFKKRHMFYVKEIEDELNTSMHRQKHSLEDNHFSITDSEMLYYKPLVNYNQEAGAAIYTEDNSVEILSDGKLMFRRLLDEIDKAKSFIHMEYYIIQDDMMFDEIKKHLYAKIKEGVEVRILYDALGSRSMTKKKWKKLEENGIKIGDFFPAKLRSFHIRVNYRNHRKIVVIDNKAGFVGGYNIGREYLSLDKRFGYWRDTHLFLTGSAVTALGIRFALDWNYASKENLFLRGIFFKEQYPALKGKTGVQIITSGPDSKEAQIRNTYVAMIHAAKKCISIQTPYFIPDQTVVSALEIAIRSGVEVRLMIPCKPDHPFVYWATYSYMGDLLEKGAHCYIYKGGFLHAKGLVIDGEVLCYGTANMDIRSFKLNFEVNAVIYDRNTALEMEELFEQDMGQCEEITLIKYRQRSFMIRFKEQVFRLLSPVL